MKFFRLIFVLVLMLSVSACSKVESLELKKVEKFAVNNLTAQGADIELDLIVYNPNGFKIKVTDYELDVFINNVRIGKAELDQRLVLPKKAESSQHVNVQVQFKNMLFGAIPVLASLKKGKTATLRLSGNVEGAALFYKKDVKIDFEKDISLTK